MRVFSLVGVCLLAACNERPPKPLDPQPPYVMENGVTVQVLRPGDGKAVKKGGKVSVHFVGTLLDGGVFDSSRARNRPFDFWVGEGQVVEGLDQALLGAREGELRRISVPAALGYGRASKPTIPANSPLVFEVELLDVR